MSEALGRFAAIDVGSNAMRLIIARIYNPNAPFLKREAAYRIPLRLGEDAFGKGEIQPETLRDMIEVFQGFKHRIL